jgi:hypothetical protein
VSDRRVGSSVTFHCCLWSVYVSKCLFSILDTSFGVLGHFRPPIAAHASHSTVVDSGRRHGRLEGASGLLSALAAAGKYT